VQIEEDPVAAYAPAILAIGKFLDVARKGILSHFGQHRQNALSIIARNPL